MKDNKSLQVEGVGEKLAYTSMVYIPHRFQGGFLFFFLYIFRGKKMREREGYRRSKMCDSMGLLLLF